MLEELNNPAARILIAEDEAIVAEALALTLRAFGYQVVRTVSTGELAIKVAEESKPDLILMDINLRGEIDGIQASEQIRARFDVPVIFLTAYEKEDVLSRAKVTEPYGFIAKPHSNYILQTTIEGALYKHGADKRVRESEERYRMLVEQSIDGIALIEGTTLRFVNLALAKMFGFYNKEEAEGQDFMNFVAPECRDSMKQRGFESEEGKSVPDYYEFTALRNDGTSFTAEATVNLTTYQGGKARQAIIRDISERKKLEQALRQSQEMLSLALEGGNLEVWDWDLTTGKAIWSERINKMLGYTPNEFEPNLKNWKKLVHPDDWPWVSKKLNLHLEGQLPNFDVIYRAPNKSGGWQWLQAQGTITEFDSDGKPIRMTGVVADVTERKLAEEELHKLASVVRYTGDLINLATFDGKMIFLNEAGSRMLGINSTDVGQHQILEVIPEHLLQTAQREVLPLLMAGGSWEGELQYRNIKTGEITDVHAMCFAIRDSDTGSPICFANVSRDISERKKAEEALKVEKRRFEVLSENSPFGLAMIKRDGAFEYVNRMFHGMLGYDLSEIPTGRDWFRKAYPDGEYRHRVIAAWKEDLEGLVPGGTRSRIFEVTCKDGSRKTILFRPVKLDADEDLMTCEDITDRIRAEEALRQSEEKYKVLVEESFDGIFVQKGTKIVFTNSRLREMLGYGEGELEGQHHWLVYHPEYQEITRERAKARRRGEPAPSRYEVRMQRKDGSSFEAEINARAVEFVGETGIQVWIRDISDQKQAENALREREATLRTILQAAPIGIGQVSSDRTLGWTNQYLLDLLGYAAEELTGKSARVLYDSDEEFLRVGSVKHPLVIRNGIGTVETVFRRKDGSVLDILLSSASILPGDLSGGLVFTATDITERKQADEALQIKDSAMTSSISGIAIGDFAGNVIYANPAVLRLWGYDHEGEILGRPIREFWLIDEKAEAAWRAAAQSGYWIGELVARKRDGSSAYFQAAISLLRRADGKPRAIMGSFMDITDRKRAEEALRESEYRYRTLFEESIDAVYITTREGILVDANQAYLDLFGFSKEEARNVEILQIYTDVADRKRFQKEIERKGSLKDYEVTFRKKDGTRIDGLLTSTVRRDKDGTVLGYQGIIRDVTERKQLQRQLLQAQKMEAIGTLAGGIAHDFNNLLQVTIGYSDLLLSRKDKTDPEYARLQQILKAGRSGTELVQRLLTLSRKTESKQRPIDLNSQIKQARKLLDRTIPKMIKIDLRLAELLATVNADPTQIEQIIMNLAVNARDAMPEGGEVTLSTENVILDENYCRVNPGAKPGKYVLLAVSDNGCGMDKEILDHMFEPFFTTKGVRKGTGLGLAVVYGIVKQHAGYVSCESRPGHGTVFRVYLPAIEEEEIVSDELVEEPQLSGGTETILLVDDEDVVRELGELILGEYGYRVLTAKNGKEALEIYQNEKGRIALVILDWLMPEMGGKQCMQGLLKLNPTIRVLVASGYASGGTARDAVELGAKSFVNKPFEVAQLLQQVRKLLDLQI